MMRYLLDTNHLSPFVTVGHPLRPRILQQMRQGDQFAIAVPALAEFLYGIQVVPRGGQNLIEWNQLRLTFFFYHIDQIDAEQASSLQVDLRRRGRQLYTVDAFIAAIGLRYGLTLLTTDKDFQAVMGLAQENWLVG